MAIIHRIGFVVTGDELINGDILNTNGQFFSQEFLQNALVPGQQVIVGDDENDIFAAIEYLKPHHSAIITIGGLGPTKDDRTRQGLAQATHLPLDFHPEAWQWITEKITSLGYPSVPETNRQQAFFPRGAEVWRNIHGTAAACYFQHDKHHYFMLPGPPNECRPIFSKHVLPKLIALKLTTNIFRKFWLLLGVSEGQIASEIEPFMDNFPDCQIGYRVQYPYLEVKLSSQNKKSLEQLSDQFSKHFDKAVISDQRQTASEQLKNLILQKKLTLRIEDKATEGALLQTLLSPKTYPFLKAQSPSLTIKLNGLENYWNVKEDEQHCPVTLKLESTHQSKQIDLKIPYRGSKTILNTIERVCWHAIQFVEFVKNSA